MNDYHSNFDHLGNPIDQSPPWTWHDAVLCVFFVFTLIFTTGVFQ